MSKLIPSLRARRACRDNPKESIPAPHAARSMPVADALHDRSLALPLYIGMRSVELDRGADALAEALA